MTAKEVSRETGEDLRDIGRALWQWWRYAFQDMQNIANVMQGQPHKPTQRKIVFDLDDYTPKGKTMTVMYYASRDAADPRDDESAAMAHSDIYKGTSLTAAQAYLVGSIDREVNYLRSCKSDKRADELEAIITAAHELTPDTGKAWTRASIDAAGITFSIVRTER